MNYELVDAKYVKDFVVWVRFDDGVQGEIDLKPELYGPVFEPLLDPSQFRKFSIHPEFHTLVWESGADIAPVSSRKGAKQRDGTRESSDIARHGRSKLAASKNHFRLFQIKSLNIEPFEPFES
jgi:hypothetical protein